MDQQANKLYFATWRRTFLVAATSKGLAYISSPNESEEQFRLWANRTFPIAELIPEETKLHFYMRELDEYMQGRRQYFSFACDIKGTSFQQAVWQALQGIPFGETVTYSDSAAEISKPSAVRAVGTAIGTNPVLIAVPCYRVISKSGRGSGYRGGLA